MKAKHLVLNGADLSLADLAEFENVRPEVRLSDDARNAMNRSARMVREVIETDKISYGINTGFGAFANRRISRKRVDQLQYNLVRSHSCGVGAPLGPHIVRLVMLLKANSLSAGVSGVRPEVVEMLLALLNNEVIPKIPSRGSVGASGDLAPLAHLALTMIGEGEADYRQQNLSGKEVLQAVGRDPLKLQAKEGLALLNGTQVSTALAVQGLLTGEHLLQTSIISGALSLEGLAGSHRAFDARIHAARKLEGQINVASKFRELLTPSEINKSHADCDRVQDPYSLRCMPQVLGAVWDTLEHSSRILGKECNGVSDNPLIFDDDVVSGGNFHAEPIGFVSDFLGIAVAEVASLAERRVDLLMRRVNPNLNMFLADNPGVESGFMLPHVVAAALTSENKTLAHPASVDSITTSAGQEDHVSMATWAGLKLETICNNTARVLAVELLAAARAIDAQRPLKTTEPLERVHATLRGNVPLQRADHRSDGEIETIAEMIQRGGLRHHLSNLSPLTATPT